MNGAVLDADFWVILQYVGQQDGSFMGVVLLCVAVAVMLHCFYIYHLWLVSKGLSTNEQDKRVKTRTFLERYLITLKKYETHYSADGKQESKPTKETRERYALTGDESLADLKKMG